MTGLKIWTFCRPICARRRRRISSSLLPLNMLPVMTSIQPCWDWLRTTSTSGSGLVFAGLGADPHLVAFVDEWRHLDDEAGLERRRLDLRARGGALDAGHGLLDDQVDSGRQLDADRLDVVELDADDRVGDQVVLRVAERLAGDMDLLVGRRIHEIEMVAVVVEVLHLPLVEDGALDVFLGAELVIRERLGPDVAHARLDVRALVARR